MKQMIAGRHHDCLRFFLLGFDVFGNLHHAYRANVFVRHRHALIIVVLRWQEPTGYKESRSQMVLTKKQRNLSHDPQDEEETKLKAFRPRYPMTTHAAAYRVVGWRFHIVLRVAILVQRENQSRGRHDKNVIGKKPSANIII